MATFTVTDRLDLTGTVSYGECLVMVRLVYIWELEERLLINKDRSPTDQRYNTGILESQEMPFVPFIDEKIVGYYE